MVPNYLVIVKGATITFAANDCNDAGPPDVSVENPPCSGFTSGTGCSQTAPCTFAIGTVVSIGDIVISQYTDLPGCSGTPSTGPISVVFEDYTGAKISMKFSTCFANTPSSGLYENIFTGSWTVPQNTKTGAQAVNFTSTDTSNGQTANAIAYVSATASIAANCLVNGVALTPTSSITVNNPALSFSCTPTTGSQYVSGVTIQITNSTSTLVSTPMTLSSGAYTYSYTLPRPGVYTVTGTAQLSCTNCQPVTIMSVIAPFGSSPLPVNYDNSILGLAMILSGASILAIQSKPRKH